MLAPLLECNIFSSETNCTVKTKTPKNYLFTFFWRREKTLCPPWDWVWITWLPCFHTLRLFVNTEACFVDMLPCIMKRFRTHAKFTMSDCTTLSVCSTSNLLETENCFIASRAHCWSLGLRNAGNILQSLVPKKMRRCN